MFTISNQFKLPDNYSIKKRRARHRMEWGNVFDLKARDCDRCGKSLRDKEDVYQVYGDPPSHSEYIICVDCGEEIKVAENL